MFISLCLFLLSIESGLASDIPRVAIAHLSAGNVSGSVMFTETSEGVRLTGEITGMRPGHYGFHIHELGNVYTCNDAGAHFNPKEVNHGGRDHEVRHVGDLGNLEFKVGEVTSVINFTDSVIALRGSNNILGRSLMLHAERDDYGLGGDATSLTTGNAGARVACGVIGIHAPVGAWNASANVMPSILLVFIATVSLFTKNISF